MALDEKIEAVDKISKALGKQSTADMDVVERIPPNKDHFDSLINQETQQPQNQINVKATEEANLAVQKPNPTSLMDELKKLNTKVSKISHMSPEDLRNQARDVIAQIENVKTQLANVQEIRPAFHTVLHNKLTHIDESLRIAMNKAGVEYKLPPPDTQITGRVNPIEKFIGYLTQSQHQLAHLGQTIEQLGLTDGKTLTPAHMLALQMKVGYVQQQIELFTSLLNKALESTKTIFNTQV